MVRFGMFALSLIVLAGCAGSSSKTPAIPETLPDLTSWKYQDNEYTSSLGQTLPAGSDGKNAVFLAKVYVNETAHLDAWELHYRADDGNWKVFAKIWEESEVWQETSRVIYIRSAILLPDGTWQIGKRGESLKFAAILRDSQKRIVSFKYGLVDSESKLQSPEIMINVTPR